MSKTNPNYSFEDVINKIKESIGSEYDIDYEEISRIEVQSVGDICHLSLSISDADPVGISIVGQKFAIVMVNDAMTYTVVGSGELKRQIDFSYCVFMVER